MKFKPIKKWYRKQIKNNSFFKIKLKFAFYTLLQIIIIKIIFILMIINQIIISLLEIKTLFFSLNFICVYLYQFNNISLISLLYTNKIYNINKKMQCLLKFVCFYLLNKQLKKKQY